MIEKNLKRFAIERGLYDSEMNFCARRYRELWNIFGFNPCYGKTLREWYKLKTINDVNGCRDGSGFNKPYARFLKCRLFRYRGYYIKRGLYAKASQ